MEEAATNSDEAAQAIAAYLAASEVSLRSTQDLNDAWRRHFEANAEPPSKEWIVEVAAQQMACDLALGRARAAIEAPVSVQVPETASAGELEEPPLTRQRRRLRRENKLLARIGIPGKRMLRATLIVLLALAVLVATGAGISLALEVAGILHLIDDPVQLPFGIQLAIFIAATGVSYGLKRALKLVERALYGSKGIRPKGFQL